MLHIHTIVVIIMNLKNRGGAQRLWMFAMMGLREVPRHVFRHQLPSIMLHIKRSSLHIMSPSSDKPLAAPFIERFEEGVTLWRIFAYFEWKGPIALSSAFWMAVPLKRAGVPLQPLQLLVLPLYAPRPSTNQVFSPASGGRGIVGLIYL